MSYLLSVANGTTAGLVKPGFATTIDSDGTLHARPAARMGGWFNVMLDGGATGNGTTIDYAALQAGINTAVTAGLAIYFPPGSYNIGANTLVFGGGSVGPLNVYGVPGKTFIVSTSSAVDIVHIGDGNRPGTTLPQTNSTLGSTFHGINIVGAGTPAVQSGQIGILINGMVHVTVSKCQVEYTDIGYDMINNCFGAHFQECRAGSGYSCNVGANLRGAPGSGCGNQIVFENCWISGGVAGYHISNADGINIRNGQCGSGTAGLGADFNGGVVLGKDYLTQSVNGQNVGQIIIDGVDFEGFRGWVVRGYGQGLLTIKNCPIISYGASPTDTNCAVGVIKLTNAQNFILHIADNFVRNYFTSPQSIVIQGYGGGTYFEHNTGGDNSYFNNVALGQNMLAQSGVLPGISIFHDYGQGDMIRLGGLYIRSNGAGVVQTSTDKASWTAVGIAPPTAITFAATMTPDMRQNPLQTLTMTGNATLAMPTMTPGGAYQIRIGQDATGGRIMTWPSAFKWSGGAAPALSTAANAVDLLVFHSFDGITAMAMLTKGFA